jgi:hypothetical protein
MRVTGWPCRLLLSLTVTLVASAAYPQQPSLAEIARKEAERRKALPAAPKVYTNKDLPASALKPAAPGEPSAAAPAEAGPGPASAPPTAAPQAETPAPPGETKDEAWWKGRVNAAREELRRNEMFAEALQSRINALTRDFTSRDNPVQRRALGEQRIQAVNELGRVMQDVERGRKQIADIEEEARQAGVPPGWLR